MKRTNLQRFFKHVFYWFWFSCSLNWENIHFEEHVFWDIEVNNRLALLVRQIYYFSGGQDVYSFMIYTMHIYFISFRQEKHKLCFPYFQPSNHCWSNIWKGGMVVWASQVWAMKRRVAPSGSNVPMQMVQGTGMAPNQMEMHTTLLTEARSSWSIVLVNFAVTCVYHESGTCSLSIFDRIEDI